MALSRLKYGGVYTHWFVSGDDNDAIHRALRVTGDAYKLLEAGVGDSAGYGSYILMRNKSFEEAEEGYRARWGEPRDILGMSMPPRNEEMELMVIIRFT